MNEKINILLIEDNPADARLIDIYLKESFGKSYSLTTCDYLSKGIDQLSKIKFNIIILDLALPDSTGLETLNKVKEFSSGIPIIVLTGYDDEAIGLSAIRLGAQNFLVKGKVTSKGLKRTLEYSMERFRLLKELSDKTKKLEEKTQEILLEQSKLSEAQKLAHIGNWEWDIGTKTVYWSDEMYRIFGLEPQSVKITYEEYMKRVLPEDRELLDSILWKGYQRKQERKAFIRIVHDNGMVRILLMRGAVLTDAKDSPVKMYGTAQDITEMKQMEDELQKSKKGLEIKVEERTSDLATAIKNLEKEIEERTKAQNELKYEKEKLQKYLRIAKVVFLVLNRNYEVELINKKGCEITGYSEKELLGKNWLEIVPPGYKNSVERAFTLLMTGKEEPVEFFENAIITQSGEERLLAWHNTVVKNGSGSIVGILSSGEDITEKKSAERALQQSEEKYRKLVENMNEGILVVNNEDVIQFVNNKFCEIVGYSEKELLGQMAYQLLLEGNNKKFMKERMKRREQGITDQYEIKIRTKSDNSVWILVSATPVYDDYGKVIGSLGIHSDITERKNYEAEITKLSLALSKSENSIIITDNEGKIEWVNEGFERLTGYTIDEVKGTSGEVLRRGHPTGVSKSTSHFKHLLKEKKSVSYESHNYSKTDREYWMYTTLTPILNVNGELEKIIAVDSDITLRKKTEEELRKAKEVAEESARSKETFLANMSHEIRTPMNAIMGIIQLLQDTELTPQQKKYLISVDFAAGSLLRIINDILDLSKIGSGKLNIEEINFSPADVINGIINSASYNAKEKQLQLSSDIDPQIPAQLVGDPVRLNQILSNLVTNSIKFTDKGNIVVRAKVLQEKKKSVKVKFEVEDTGIGIPKDKQEVIFKEFEQADAKTSRRYGGTGLGLAIVKRLVDLMGGKISVKSEPDKGALFSVTLDFNIAKKEEIVFVAPRVENIPSTVTLQGIRVLLVEDNELNQMVASQFLKNWGIITEVVPDGKDAIEILRKKDYDMVLMDIQMPEMNGYETTDYIRNKFTGDKQKVPILAMTAHAFRDEEEKCLRAGMDGYISKPLSREALYNKIYSLLKKNGNKKPATKIIAPNGNGKPR